MTFHFKPAADFTERAGIFVALVGGTNSGKTVSALRLARGIAGPTGKVAIIDTEGGRALHLKQHFVFDVDLMAPPFRPDRFADGAKTAEDAGYDCVVFDSFSMEWAGLGGVLSWQEAELDRMAGDDFKKRERSKMASWIKPKMAHKAMVYSLLQRRIPIIFSIRGEESVKPGESGEKPVKVFKAICNPQFPFEVTVSFRLAADRKGIIDLSDPSAWKMEGDHRSIFADGEQLSEEHGEKLAAWARGGATPAAAPKPKWQEHMDAMLGDLAAAQDAKGVFAAIDKHRQARDWLREKRPAESAIVERAFSDAHTLHMAPADAGEAPGPAAAA